jgi:vacuolar-type H+-ATPase subunit H
MRSELINDILSVETEAERIVQSAKEECRRRLATAHEQGEALVKATVDEARARRFAALESAQKESNGRVAAFQAAVVAQSECMADDSERLERAVQHLLALLSSSSCTEDHGR